MQQTSFLRPRAAIVRAGVSRATFYSLIKKGLWPKPIALGPRSRAFPDYEVELMNQARVAGKSDDEIRALVTRLEAVRKTLPLRLNQGSVETAGQGG